MGKRQEQVFDDLLNIVSYQRNANDNHYKVLL